MAIASFLITYVFFGVIAFLLGRRSKAKPSTVRWILLAFLVLVSQWILVGTRVIDIFDLKIYANQALQALAFGTLVGLLSRHTRVSTP